MLYPLAIDTRKDAMNLPINDDENLWVSWDEYHRLIARLALNVHESGWKFDQILCLARGGLRVGDQMSRIFDVPLAILATSSYREAAGTQQGELDIAQYITMTRGNLSGKILLVDDLVDSGVTLERVGRHLKERYPEVTDVRSAVLWYKACSKVTRLPRDVPAFEPVDSPAVRRVRHAASA
jgi:hypoxanthine phosphoribosyltransferase